MSDTASKPSSTSHQSPPTRVLAAILDFSAADLAENRAGRLAPGQLARLNRELRTNWLLFGIAAVLFVLVAAIAVIAAMATAALIFGGLGILLLAGFFWGLRRQSHRMRARGVERLQGELTVASSRRRRASGGRSSTAHTLTIGGMRFDIEPELFEALQEMLAAGVTAYTLYYLPRDKRVLALTPGLDSPSAIASGNGEPAPDERTLERWRQGQRDVEWAIAVLEGRQFNGNGSNAGDGDEGDDGDDRDDRDEGSDAPTAIRVQAQEILRGAGPNAIPALASLLYKPHYRDIVAQMGADAVAPLMRVVAREGDLVESARLNGIVRTLNQIALEELEETLPGYVQRFHPPAVRMAALRVLSHRRHPQRIEFLRQAALDPEPAIAAYAQQTLAHMVDLYGRA